MRLQRVFLHPPGTLAHRWVTPNIKFAAVPIYTPGWSGADLCLLSTNTTQCPRQGLDAGQLVLESSALAMRPHEYHKLPPKQLRILRHEAINH